MDNFRIDITAEGKDVLAAAMEIAFGGKVARRYAVRLPATEVADPPLPAHVKVVKTLRLVFLWSDKESADAVLLPFSLDGAGAADFAHRWLSEALYPREPDHDGSNGRGWRLYNEAWGHVDDDPYAIVAVAPAWAMYGK